MSIWSLGNSIVTQLGNEMLSRVQAGVGNITISRIVTGSGRVEEDKLYVQTSVKNEEQGMSLLSVNSTGTGSSLNLMVTNDSLTKSYSLNQIGVYATHPDMGEVLYMIAQCDSGTADVIPLPEDTPLVLNYKFHIIHGESANLEFTVDPLGVTPLDMFNGHINAQNPHSITANTVGLGNVPNVATNDQTPTYTEGTSVAELSSGEKLSVAFGKIAKAISYLKKLSGASNEAISDNSIALGSNNVSGSNAFKITNIADKVITLTSVTGIKEVLNAESTIQYSCQLTENYDLCGNITDVDETNKTITVDIIPNSTITTGILWIPSHPELGDGETIIGIGALATGNNNKASQIGSFVAGQDNIAGGKYSGVFGRGNIAGFSSLVGGEGNKAHQWSLIGGYSNDITKQFSFIVGYGNKINADKSGIIGEANEIKSGTGSFIIGRKNTSQYSADNPLSDPGCNFVGGYNSVLVGKRSFVFGTSLGSGPTAGYGNYVIAIGAGAQAGNPDAPSNSPTQGAVSIGWGTKALYNFSTALGTNTQTAADKQLVCGTWNTLNTNSAFMVGNGKDATHRSYAFNVTKDGQALLGSADILNDDKAVTTKKYVDTIAEGESGTWTPTFPYLVPDENRTDYNIKGTGRYIKQGNVMHIYGDVSIVKPSNLSTTIHSIFYLYGLPQIPGGRDAIIPCTILSGDNMIKCFITYRYGTYRLMKTSDTQDCIFWQDLPNKFTVYIVGSYII